jgi:chorismate synthase
MSAGSNKFGHLFQWTTFGESHGQAMGLIIDGCPSGVEVNLDLLNSNLAKRRPGQANPLGAEILSERNEEDRPQILSGVFENKTLGTPISIIVENKNQKSQDYELIKNQPRVGHADDLWKSKFSHWDHRGGGRASARETLNWVIAGSFAQMFCKSQIADLKVIAQIKSVGSLVVTSLNDSQLIDMLKNAKEMGESFGAIISVEIFALPANIGEPIFKKLKSELAHAFMTINACNGVEIGEGFLLSSKKGTEVHKLSESRAYGGLRGGMSTGETIHFNLSFKPTSSINDIAKKGRHDPCVALRALPIVEAMAWNVLADQLLMQRLNQA